MTSSKRMTFSLDNDICNGLVYGRVLSWFQSWKATSVASCLFA